MIKVVFVDIDNTLLSFDGYVRETMKKGFSEFGLPKFEGWMYDAFQKVNHGLWRKIEQGIITFAELSRDRWNMAFKAMGIDFDGPVFEKYFRANLRNSAVPMPGAKDMLEYLSAKYVLSAASNGPFEQQTNRLKVGDMYEHFSFFFISEQVGAQKPSREYFDYCFEKLRSSGAKELEDIQPEETMIIGDSLTSDIAGGREYGMKTCLYLGAHPDEKPDEDVADHIIYDLAEIKGIL